MLNWFRNRRSRVGNEALNNSRTKFRRAIRRPASDRPEFQPLEARKLLSAVFDNGLLTLTGTDEKDRIEVVAGDIAGQVRITGIEGVEPGTYFDGVEQIQINSLDGNDKITIGLDLVNADEDLIGVKISAGEGNNKIWAGEGDDDITVGAGKNKIWAGDGDDLIITGDGKNKIDGGAGDDLITTGAEKDKINGGAGNDIIDAGQGKNKVWGEDGDDDITTGDDKDKIDGGAGDDMIEAGHGKNKIKGGSGDDQIHSGEDRDKIKGGGGEDDVQDDNGDEDRDRQDPSDDGMDGDRLAASIGYWHNKHGQELIRALNDDGGEEAPTDLGNWLATNFNNMFGVDAGEYDLTDATNAEVADLYLMLFDRNGQDVKDLGLSGSPKFEAKVLATALSVYVTTESLAGDIALDYGFQVTEDGLGAVEINVGEHGAAFGVDNDTSLTVMELLAATNDRTFAGVMYDLDEDGDANDKTEKGLRSDASSVYSAIIENEFDEGGDEGDGNDE